MIIFKYLLLLIPFIFDAKCSKLNVPRVLLPLFYDFSMNFTLEVTEGGCYTWNTLRPNTVRLICVNAETELGCCSRVVVSSGIQDLRRTTETVLAEDVHSGLVLRCEIILDVISSLNIVTTTREIFLDESPEAFEVRAYDDQGNEFTTLEGVEFDWSFKTVGASNRSGESTVLRYITFAESPYETPRAIEPFERVGAKGHTILLEGRQTGSASVTVKLPQSEYAHVPAAGVQLLVITNLIVTPPDATILLGDNLKYRLQQFQHGKVKEIAFPSGQYHLKSMEDNVEIDAESGIATGISLGQARLVLIDGNVGAASDVKPPTASLTVATPHDLTLSILPNRKWSVVVGKSYEIIAELHDADRKRFHLGNSAAIELRLDESYFQVKARPKNGSFVQGTPLKIGTTEVVGELLGVRSPTGQVRRIGTLTATAELHIYDPVQVRPASILLPWDPVSRARYDVPLTATGGDGIFTWSSARSVVAVVNQRGVVKTLEPGVTTVTAAMTANPAIRGLSVVRVMPPVALEVLDTPLEAEVGVPIPIQVVLLADVDGKRVPFTHCDALPFDVALSDTNFNHSSLKITKLQPTACTVIHITGNEPGTCEVVIKYNDLSVTVVVAAYSPLSPLNPASGTTVLAVGTSRLIVFSGGPRSWTMKPSEHFHSLHNPDSHGENVIVSEQNGHRHAVKHFYGYRVSCQQLSETTLTLQVVNKVVGSKSTPSTATASINVICGKPKYLVLSALEMNASRCPLHAEELVALNNRDLDILVTVKDAQGRKFDNITSLDFVWTISKSTLRPVFKNLQHVTIEQDGFTFPLSFSQRIVPGGTSDSIEVHARIVGYDQEVLFSQSISAENPPFPEISDSGVLQTPDIHSSITIKLVDEIQVNPNTTEIFAGGEDLREVRVSQGSGHFEVSVNGSGVVDIERELNTIRLRAVTVGNVLLSVKDACLDTKIATVAVQVYRIGAISLDVVEYIERGKTVRARAILFDEERNRLSSVPDSTALKLLPIASSDLISLGSDISHGKGDVSFSVRGLTLGQTSLLVTAGEISSPSVPINVFTPLRLHPRNVTILAGASLPITALGGPTGAQIEWSMDEPSIARVGIDGVVGGLQIGTAVLTAKAITTRKHTGAREISSQDRIDVRVVPLKSISIHAPISQIVAGGRMPLWAAGPPGVGGLLPLGSIPQTKFTWSLSQESCAEIRPSLQPLGVYVPDTDQVAVQFYALKPGRTTVSLTVQVPGSVAGETHPVEYTDTINVQVLPQMGLSSPRPLPLEHLLVSPQATTELRITRDVRRFQVTVLRGGPDVVRVTQDGMLTTGDSTGSAVIAFGPPEKPLRHLVVYVKPIEYLMINVVPHWRMHSQRRVKVVPNEVDLELSLSYHDDEGNVFDAVRTNLMVESDQKGLVAVARGAENGTLTLNIHDSGSSSLRVWDAKPSHQPSDYLFMRVANVLFPAHARVSVGDVICLRIPLTMSEDSLSPWSVDDPGKLRLWPDVGIAVACGSRGEATISHRASPRLRSRIEILPLNKIELMPHDIILTTSPEFVADYPLILSTSGELDKRSNLVAYNGSCDVGTPKDFVPTCHPFTCRINFNNPAAPTDITHLFYSAPSFNLETGLYSCRVQSIGKASPSSATLSEQVVLTAVSLDGSIQSRSALLPFAPALYLHQNELKITHTKPRGVFVVSGVVDVFDQIKIVTDKHLVSVTLASQTDTSRTFLVTVDVAWWTLDDPPPLTVVLWSPKTQQKLQLHLKCSGHRISSDETGSYVPWLLTALAILIPLLVLVWSTRPSSRELLSTTEQAFMRTPNSGGGGDHSFSHMHNFSRNSPEMSPRRPLENYPIYGSPWRRRDN